MTAITATTLIIVLILASIMVPYVLINQSTKPTRHRTIKMVITGTPLTHLSTTPALLTDA